MTLLKRDLFGSVERMEPDGALPRLVRRDAGSARWWLRPLARALLRREARALRTLEGVHGVPKLLGRERERLYREWIEGEPMHRARPATPFYYGGALRLLRQLHARKVVHNDLAKETNWLVTPEGSPALVDFQLAHCARRRGRLFRALAYDDLRHMLKHKRSYVPHRLTARERAILARPSIVARVWMASGKRVYLFITRRILGWADREGASDRGLA